MDIEAPHYVWGDILQKNLDSSKNREYYVRPYQGKLLFRLRRRQPEILINPARAGLRRM